MLSLKSYINEEEGKHGVVAFGRMNPPTAGHEKVANKVSSVAKKHKTEHHKIVLSNAHDDHKNPLHPESKLKHAKNAFPKSNLEIAGKGENILHHAAKMHKAGVQHLHVVAGQDRHQEFHRLLHRYNDGSEHKHGSYKFKSITLHSSGDRDDSAKGTKGVSGTSQREHAKNGRRKEFHAGLPKSMHPKHKDALYHDLRKSMMKNKKLDG